MMEPDAVDVTPVGTSQAPPQLVINDSSESDEDSRHESLLKRTLSVPLNKHKRQGYQHAPTSSYSDLQNTSMYSLNEHESIIDINGEGSQGSSHDTGHPEGWPVFEPLDGPYPESWGFYCS